MRKDLLVVGELYHIYNKSIAGFKIFNDDADFSRIISEIRYYQREKPPAKFSNFIRLSKVKQIYPNINICLPQQETLISVIAYCVMPTHLHLILKQLKEKGISNFMNNILNSYTRRFNTKHKRKGPLWEGRFKNVLIKTDEHLLHLTRYIHLNPVTAHLIDKPQDWPASSYREYLSLGDENDRICKFGDILDIEPTSYREFVEDRISYQRELAKIKDLLLE